MVRKCEFCQRLFEAETGNACPLCQKAAKNNDYPPGPFTPTEKPKKFVESDGFFSEKDFLAESKGEGFHESSDYHNLSHNA